MNRYVIKSKLKSKNRQGYFSGFHRINPLYVADAMEAKTFPNSQAAHDYALRELFTSSTAFEIVAVKGGAL